MFIGARINNSRVASGGQKTVRLNTWLSKSSSGSGSDLLMNQELSILIFRDGDEIIIYRKTRTSRWS